MLVLLAQLKCSVLQICKCQELISEFFWTAMIISFVVLVILELMKYIAKKNYKTEP